MQRKRVKIKKSGGIMKLNSYERFKALKDYKVVKSNDIIQKAKYELNKNEQKIFCYAVSKIKPDDPVNKVYTLDVKEFCEILGLDYFNGGIGYYFKKLLKGLRDKSFYIENNNSSLLIGWLSEVEIVENTAKVKLTFGVKMQEYLINLKKNYTQYDLLCILPMKSGYSIRMFELLRSINGVKGPIFDMSLEEIQDRIKVSYKTYSDFRRRVIEQSVKEINQFTDLKIQWKPVKEGKKIVAIRFLVEHLSEKELRTNTFNALKQLNLNALENIVSSL